MRIILLGIFFICLNTFTGSTFDTLTKYSGINNYMWYHYYSVGGTVAILSFLIFLFFQDGIKKNIILKKKEFYYLPIFRGILSTIYVDVNKNINFINVYKYLKKYYQSEQFIKVLSPNKMISTNDVINTNLCKLSICKSKQHNKIIILSAIDNLIKGGSGQALQNFNIKFNFNEKLGLI